MRIKTNILRIVSITLTLLLLIAPALAIPESGAERLALLNEINGLIDKYALYPPEEFLYLDTSAEQLEGEEGLLLLKYILNTWQAGDPYGSLMTREEYDLAFDTGTPLYGIGIQVDTSMPLGVYVADFLPGGGAESSGMEVGAQIVSVDGVDIADAVYMEVRPLFLGNWWTSVEIGYINPGSVEVFTERIQRGSLRVDNVRGHLIEGSDIGYISISRFGSLADYFDFYRYYHEYLPEMGARSVIIDLRACPGGQVDAMVNILNCVLLEEGYLLFEYVDAEGNIPVYSTGWDIEEMVKNGDRFWQPEKTVIMIDGGSASASEIFAGTMQVYGKAELVGEKSYGKAHSQYHIPLSSRDVLITTGSRIDLFEIGSYHGAGITPDHTVEWGTAAGADILTRPLATDRALFKQSVMTERIAAMQERMALLGFYRTEPSGVFDEYTLWCLNRFQVAYKLPQGRFANVETLKALDKAAMEKTVYIDRQMEFALELLGWGSADQHGVAE
jgi:carboxyl-terminal processing protease